MRWLDQVTAELLPLLAAWIFLSGVDDLVLDLAFLWHWARIRVRSSGRPILRRPSGSQERKIALLIPCWRESDVIGEMLSRNLARIEYQHYDVWLGLYPNDPETRRAVAAFEARFPSVHTAICPGPGPTTKADCLNSIFESICRHEAQTGKRYEIVVHHDAEDVIHPRSFFLFNRVIGPYAMAQLPVLPLATPWSNLTHGIYCDEFAEFHLKELPLRAQMGGFVPSAGVGTAYSRGALERLVRKRRGRIFDADSLTEDYLMGLEMKRFGFPQTFLGPRQATRLLPPSEKVREGESRRGVLATRSYFPRGLRAAIRQRTRWVTGISLQSWQRFGWSAGPGQLYWLWRDRKGLISHPVSLLANLLLLYGGGRWMWAEFSGTPWHLGGILTHPAIFLLITLNLVVLTWRQVFRAAFAGLVYGWPHALLAAVRAPWANLINSLATLRAAFCFAKAWFLRKPLVWTKTQHAYPPPSEAASQRRIGDILVSLGVVRRAELEGILKAHKNGYRTGEALVRKGVISERQLGEALHLQQGRPLHLFRPRPGEMQVAGD